MKIVELVMEEGVQGGRGMYNLYNICIIYLFITLEMSALSEVLSALCANLYPPTLLSQCLGRGGGDCRLV